MARLFIEALSLAGCHVDIASRFRSYDSGNHDRQVRLEKLGTAIANRLVRRYQSATAGERPDLWFTYHLYHKAPDWLGPSVARKLQIPYVVAEGASSPKQRDGPWSLGHRAASQALASADLVMGLNPKDAATVEPLLSDPEKYVGFPPFIDAVPFQEARQAFGQNEPDHRAEPVLLTVAMMREDQKLQSYRVLGEALAQLQDLPWTLRIVGDGPARSTVKSVFSGLEHRIRWLGEQDGSELAAIYARSDLFVWPAVKEAYGMVFLEAAAAGLPIVAGDGAGVAQIVRNEVNGLLAPQGDSSRFAASVRSMLLDREAAHEMGAAGSRLVSEHHSLPAAADRLKGLLSRFSDLPASRRGGSAP